MKHVDGSRWETGAKPESRASGPRIDDFGDLEPGGAAPPPGLARRLLALPDAWLKRSRLRLELGRISARDLRDAGLSVEAAEHEIGRPFWRPLDPERK